MDPLKRFVLASRKYLPSPLEILFVAEAPPAIKVNRLFYFLDVASGDTLFLEMMKVLYPEMVGFSGGSFHADASAKQIRKRKSELLAKFRADGYYLIDAYSKPMPDGASSGTKAKLMRSDLPTLRGALQELLSRRGTPIVLIGGLTYTVCADPLRAEGWNVVNQSMIDHPSRGGQIRFRSKLGAALASLKASR